MPLTRITHRRETSPFGPLFQNQRRRRRSVPVRQPPRSRTMDEEFQGSVCSKARVKVILHLGSETYSVSPGTGILSQQLATAKEESTRILKDYITKHNVPNDVPDEPLEGTSDDEGEELHTPCKKTKKQK